MIEQRLAALKRNRPRNRFLRSSVWVLVALTVYAWSSGAVEVAELFSSRRIENLERFITHDAVPYPLRDRAFDWGVLWTWASGVWVERGQEAALATIAISVLAIVLAAGLSVVLAPLAASNLATRTPFDPSTDGEFLRWRVCRIATRAVMIFLRGIPEYVLAFLFLAVLGPGHAWPAVLALALHNGGILGRLGAETIENVDAGALRSLRAIGASRRTVLATGVFPLTLGRYLLYFFYRFETCVREATVLGMLGVVSLGYWIQDAREKLYYDEMLLLIAVGALIVLAADFASAIARRYIRHGA